MFLDAVAPMLKKPHLAWDLIRLGGDKDGGYWVPQSLIGIVGCISPGVGESTKFEDELWDKHKIPSMLIDASVKPPNLVSKSVFVSKYIKSVKHNNPEATTLAECVRRADAIFGNGDLILQMDIEGDEYEVLNEISEECLSRFRIIIIEFHNLERWRNNIFFRQEVYPALEKLYKQFLVVNFEYNQINDTRYHLYGQYLPTCLEVTFLSRKFVDGQLGLGETRSS